MCPPEDAIRSKRPISLLTPKALAAKAGRAKRVLDSHEPIDEIAGIINRPMLTSSSSSGAPRKQAI
jgi:hypothetical protein